MLFFFFNSQRKCYWGLSHYPTATYFRKPKPWTDELNMLISEVDHEEFNGTN